MICLWKFIKIRWSTLYQDIIKLNSGCQLTCQSTGLIRASPSNDHSRPTHTAAARQHLRHLFSLHEKRTSQTACWVIIQAIWLSGAVHTHPPRALWCLSTFSSSRMRVMNHNWSATKQRPHPQSVAEISRHSVLSGDRIRQCETSSGSRHKDTDQ